MFCPCLLGVVQIGHCNWEFVPYGLYQSIPFLKYLIYTPSYHSLHHSRVHTNFCLFMPFYDFIGGTLELDRAAAASPATQGQVAKVGWTSDRIHRDARARGFEAPACVFLAHGTELLSAVHLPMAFRSFAKVRSVIPRSA